MKWLFKWALRLVLAVIAIVALLLAFKNPLVRVAAERRIYSRTGMVASIGRLSSRLPAPVVTIEELKLSNTAEFGGTPFLHIRELHFEIDEPALAQGKLRLRLLRLNVAQVDIVRNELGQTNIHVLLGTAHAGSARRGELGRLLGDLQFGGIDVLNVSLGKVRYIDSRDPTRNREVTANLRNQVFRNINSEADLSGALFMLWLKSDRSEVPVPEVLPRGSGLVPTSQPGPGVNTRPARHP